jgi:hypothetical protein
MQANAINPLKNIAQAVTFASKGKSSGLVWFKNKEINNYGRAPLTTERKEWHRMSTWQTLLTIEDKIADGNYFSPTAPIDLKLTQAELKYLREYCKVVIDENSNFASFKSFLIHGFKREGWISNAGKAAKLYGRIKEIEAKKL